jgi:hypothetical protein
VLTISANSGEKEISTFSVPSSSALSTIYSTRLVTVATTVQRTVSVTNTTTMLSQPQQDYTPLGIAVVAVFGMTAVVIMVIVFVRLQRQR